MYIYKPIYGEILRGLPKMFVFCKFLKNFDGFRQNNAQGF